MQTVVPDLARLTGDFIKPSPLSRRASPRHRRMPPRFTEELTVGSQATYSLLIYPRPSHAPQAGSWSIPSAPSMQTQRKTRARGDEIRKSQEGNGNGPF